MIRPALLAAYRNTVYQVGDAGIRIGSGCPGIRIGRGCPGIRIGRGCRGMDRLLLAHGVRQAGLISADNPFSVSMPGGWNRRMRVRLAEALAGRRFLPATGHWRRWSEAHFLVFGDPRPVIGLARRFRQNAIVIVRLRQPAHLLITL